MVGLSLLTLVVFGFNNLVGAQESLVRDLESWCKGAPTLYVVPPVDTHERVAGMPAALVEEVTTPPAPPAAPGYTNRLTLISLARVLDPERATAVVSVEEIDP